MRSKLFDDVPKTTKVSEGQWVRIYPDEGHGYRLFDPLREVELGRILFDSDDNWVYDGQALDVYEQEDIAAVITGSHKEMNELLESLKEK